MLPFKFTDVKSLGLTDSKPVPKHQYELTDSDGGMWTFGVFDTGLVEFNRVPLKYNEFRGKKEWRPFFRDVSNAVIKAVESWKIKKDLTPSTAKTFEDIIDEL
jgi:hypothetical protein